VGCSFSEYHSDNGIIQASLRCGIENVNGFSDYRQAWYVHGTTSASGTTNKFASGRCTYIAAEASSYQDLINLEDCNKQALWLPRGAAVGMPEAIALSGDFASSLDDLDELPVTGSKVASKGISGTAVASSAFNLDGLCSFLSCYSINYGAPTYYLVDRWVVEAFY
jgi:hypothetical protein